MGFVNDDDDGNYFFIDDLFIQSKRVVNND